ncbi:hypothetical protein K3495_g12389 [Podosphaera aphanis]|nr:hypothetical protein K3495_g12389 [Podosphaera aphanis]
MVVAENLEGASPEGDNEAPKEWARLELQLFPELWDDWASFAQRLRASVQEYKQRFEYLCKETRFPQQVWGEEFFKGLIEPLQGKLLGTPFVDITNYDVVTKLAPQYECGYQMQKRLKSAPVNSKPRFHKPSFTDSKGDTHASSVHSHSTQDGKLSQEIKDYRKKNNLSKEGKPPPTAPSVKVCHPTPPKTPFTIAGLNNGKSVELLGHIRGAKARILVDGAAQVNACTSNIMIANPNRNKIPLNKKICSFDGNIAVPADLAYESTLNTKLAGVFN